jgi:hypothetical protein
MLGIEATRFSRWKYLTEIPHPWKKQLYIKGTKLPAAVIWTAMVVNKLTREEAATNWDLPLEVIDEVVEYCEANKELLQMEAVEEGRRLTRKGIQLEPNLFLDEDS